MKITLAKSAGFCFGVKRAIDIAFQTASCGKEVYMLGDIVHNETVVEKIKRAGIKKIFRLKPKKNAVLLISAHGSPKKTYQKAKKLGFQIVDATCPMVKHIHTIVKKYERLGFPIIVIGDKKHTEVKAIVGQLSKKALVIEAINTLPYSKISKLKKACVVAQSTQNIHKVETIIKALKHYINNLKFFNTICQPTRKKQEEIHRLPQENDVMIIIGSRTSANTRRLFEISHSINPHTYWINSATQLKKKWFEKAKTVAVTAGASTPEEIIQEVISTLKTIKNNLCA
ncbi:MAG: 4-hydroxy-3-methylbut-2-enyl diphosphate reductase [Candidatus Omnitrophica bacterium]|nr:4-hydroxy-3-methylbut-2-enyl diphosphate reductase [Candidatus Omnitrophota bacterium]